MPRAHFAVDCHAHVFSATAAAVADARYRPSYAATLPDWQARWRTAGITHGVIVQPSFYGTDNGEALAAVAALPDRLRGVVVLDEGTTLPSLEALSRRGARALRLNLRGQPHDAASLAG